LQSRKKQLAIGGKALVKGGSYREVKKLTQSNENQIIYHKCINKDDINLKTAILKVFSNIILL